MDKGNTAARTVRVLLLAALLPLAGCATGPNANPTDPLEPLNRKVSDFNEGLDLVLLKPGATLYRENVPALVRTGVSNFFGNLGDAWSAVNSALQFKLGHAGENWMRFTFNTVFGFGGVLDIASELNIERHREDFGQTLGHWGVPAGPYVVLPFFGPSTLRDTAALPIDRRGDPVRDLNHAGERNTLYVLRAVDVRSNLLRASEVLEGAALDRYSFIRDSYLQRRRAEIGFRTGGERPAGSDGSDDSDGQLPELDGSANQAPGAAPAGAVPSR